MAPETAQFPLPLDLDWPAGTHDRTAIFRRMTVAYGLSFDFIGLDQHRFPDEIEVIKGGDEPPPERYHAPSKDEV